MKVSYYSHCGRVFMSVDAECPQCGWAGDRVASADGTPTQVGKDRLNSLMAFSSTMRQVSDSVDARRDRERPTGPPMRKRTCRSCGRYRAGDMQGRVRVRGLLAQTAPQDFISPGTPICTCVGREHTNGPPPLIGTVTGVTVPQQEERSRPGGVWDIPTDKPIREPITFYKVSWATERSLKDLHWNLRRVGFRV